MASGNLNDRFNLLKKITATPRATQDRGREFESLVCDIFEKENILIARPFHTGDNRSEQIDGAIEVVSKIILLEIKWVESNLAASDLYAFLGKVDNKLSGTLGLFVSKETLSENFINSIAKGRLRKVLLIHGKDLDLIFDGSVSVKEYLEYVLRLYSYDNMLHFSVASYLKTRKLEDCSTDVPESVTRVYNRDKVKSFLGKVLVTSEMPEHEIMLLAKELAVSDKEEIVELLVEMYPELVEISSGNPFGLAAKKRVNAKLCLKILLKDDLPRKTSKRYFELLAKSPRYSLVHDTLWKAYSPFLSESRMEQKILKGLVEILITVRGDWNAENQLTNVIEPFWKKLSEEQRYKVFSIYLEFYVDNSREARFDQKRFAKQLIETNFEPMKSKFFWKTIEEKIETEVIKYHLETKDVEHETKLLLREYRTALDHLGIKEEKATDKISSIYSCRIENVKS